MKKIYAYNLYLYPTLNCNFNCAHCMRGKSVNEKMEIEVLEMLFENVKMVNSLHLGGGEPFFDLEIIKNILEVLKKKNVGIFWLNISSNGSLFTEEAETILNEYEEYIDYCRNCFSFSIDENPVRITLSNDKYHQDCIKQLEQHNFSLAKTYYDNIARLLNSKYYFESRDLTNVWNIGNAENLEGANNEPINYGNYYFYDEDGNVLITGPSLNVLTDGTLTEINGDIEELKTKFNYGNILDTDIFQLLIASQKKCENILEFEIAMGQEIENTDKKINALIKK